MTYKKNRIGYWLSLTLTTALTSLIAASAMAQVVGIAELSTALRSDGALITLGDAMASGKNEVAMSRFLGKAGLSTEEIAAAIRTPSAARAALVKALSAARSDAGLQKEAMELVGVKFHLNDVASDLRTQRAAVSGNPGRSTTTASASPFAQSSTATTGSKWSLTTTTASATGETVAASGTVDSRVAQIVNEVQAKIKTANIDGTVSGQFFDTAHTNSSLVAEFVGSGFESRCGNMDTAALTTYLGAISDTVSGTNAGYVPAAALETSLMARTNVDADEAHANRCHLATACSLFAGRAAAGCSVAIN